LTADLEEHLQQQVAKFFSNLELGTVSNFQLPVGFLIILFDFSRTSIFVAFTFMVL
jgi:hypothetical protein